MLFIHSDVFSAASCVSYTFIISTSIPLLPLPGHLKLSEFFKNRYDNLRCSPLLH